MHYEPSGERVMRYTVRMTHYVCTGDCGGVSDEAKSCDAEDCSKYGEPLTECNCDDGKHNEEAERTSE